VTEKSLLFETLTRIAPSRVPYDRALIVTGGHLEEPIREALGPLGARIVVEPMARNTAPCIALAAAVVAEEQPDGIMAVLPADQHIADLETFRSVFDQAAQLAATGRIVTVGIRPSHPETGYGYIRRGDALSEGVWNVDAFVEKPDLDTARGYLSHGGYDWNAGMFFMRADVLLAAVDAHMPKLAAGIAAYRKAYGTPEEDDALRQCFEQAEPISIDYGVMEHEAQNIAVIPADFGWSDVGSWRTLLDFRTGDNFVRGDVDLRDVHDSVVVSDGPHVAVIGVSGLAVVATDDAVLVTPLDRAQEVGAIAKELKANGRVELT
jgi:mannose-1-phosphate guanylyltransferase